MRLLSPLRRLRTACDGSQSIVLVILTPLIAVMIGFAADLGLSLIRQAMLERAIDVEVRDIRLGLRPADDYTGLREAICARAKVIRECESRLKLELRAMSPYAWEPLPATPDCEDLSEITLTEPRNFDTAQDNQIVVMRACAVVEPFMPKVGLGKALTLIGDGSQNVFYQVMAVTTFTKEVS